MHHYTFDNHVNENTQDCIVLALRRAGYTAYAEAKTLVTNASLLVIALIVGTSTVIR